MEYSTVQTAPDPDPTTPPVYGPSNDDIPAEEWEKAYETARQAYRNIKFQALPADRKRVAIARDVLAWLRVGKVEAQAGGYVQNFAMGDNDSTLDGGTCEACALGALFAGAAERACIEPVALSTNIDRLAPMVWAVNRGNTADIRAALAKVFDHDQLALIECAFERTPRWGNRTWTGCGPDVVEGRDQAASWAYHIADPRKRMEAIMRNIIRNKGTFNLNDPAPVPRGKKGPG